MQETNWELLKFKYEVLGASLESIANEDEVSLTVLQHCAKSWSRLSIEDMKEVPLGDLTSFEDVITKLKANTTSQGQAFQILKDRFLNSKFVELESTLLIKTIDLANSVTPTSPTASKTLKAVSDILVALKGPSKNSEDEVFTPVTKWEVTVIDSKQVNPEGV